MCCAAWGGHAKPLPIDRARWAPVQGMHQVHQLEWTPRDTRQGLTCSASPPEHIHCVQEPQAGPGVQRCVTQREQPCGQRLGSAATAGDGLHLPHVPQEPGTACTCSRPSHCKPSIVMHPAGTVALTRRLSIMFRAQSQAWAMHSWLIIWCPAGEAADHHDRDGAGNRHEVPCSAPYSPPDQASCDAGEFLARLP